VSFHGILTAPESLPNQRITAKILALHGYADPMVMPEQVQNFANEMTNAKVDWQIHMYGHVQHAFTNPEANSPDLGIIYQPTAAKRAWFAMQNFFQEVLYTLR
jgi:dienelactone hydrolase